MPGANRRAPRKNHRSLVYVWQISFNDLDCLAGRALTPERHHQSFALHFAQNVQLRDKFLETSELLSYIRQLASKFEHKSQQ